MRIVTSTQSTPEDLRGAVLAIGNFDGVHRGHQALIVRAKAMSRAHPAPGSKDSAHPAPAGVMVFEPHPRVLFQPDATLFSLTTLERKCQLFAGLGLDLTAVIGFDRELATLTADQFIESILVKRFGVRGVVVGYDFQFGRGRGGTPETLIAAGRRFGFDVDVVAPVRAGSDATPAFSSSAIRASLASGDIAGANVALGHRWRVSGTVVGGAKLGTSFGFPTANIELGPGTALGHGIYAVRVRADGRWYGGAGYFGRRPSVDDGAPRLEVFLFDFAGDLYTRTIDVEFVAFVRGDQKFDTFDALKAQMAADCARAREVIAAITAADPLAGLPLAGI